MLALFYAQVCVFKPIAQKMIPRRLYHSPSTLLEWVEYLIEHLCPNKQNQCPSMH